MGRRLGIRRSEGTSGNSRLARPTPAFVIALVALFVSLAGSAAATGVLVSSKEIRDGSIRGVDLANRTVPASKLLQGKGSGVDADKVDGLSSEQVAALPGPASSVAGLLTTRTANYSLGAGDAGDFTVQCAQGEKVTGGGSSSFGSLFLLDSRPNTETSWAVYVANMGEQSAAFTVWAICAR
jgi:hypothetical protein